MRRVAIVALVLGLAAAVPAAAQETHFTAAVLVGEQLNYNGNLDGDSTVGFQLGVNLDQFWAVQVEGAFSNPSVDTPLGMGEVPPGLIREADATLVSANLTYSFAREGRRLVPFLSGGLSWLGIDYNDPFHQGDDPSAWGFNAAAGLRYDFTGGAFAVGQVRWHALFREAQNALQISLGFGFGI